MSELCSPSAQVRQEFSPVSSNFLLRIDRRLVGGSLIVIILYGHRLPHFLRFTITTTAVVTAAITALPMMINFFMVCSSFLFLLSE